MWRLSDSLPPDLIPTNTAIYPPPKVLWFERNFRSLVLSYKEAKFLCRSRKRKIQNEKANVWWWTRVLLALGSTRFADFCTSSKTKFINHFDGWWMLGLLAVCKRPMCHKFYNFMAHSSFFITETMQFYLLYRNFMPFDNFHFRNILCKQLTIWELSIVAGLQRGGGRAFLRISRF